MAVDVDSAEALRLREALGSIGLKETGDEAALRRAALDMLNRFNRLFVDPKAPLLSTYDPAAMETIKAKIQEEFLVPDNKGVTGLQNFQAIVGKDVSFLVKDISPLVKGFASVQLNDIYRKHQDNPDNAATEALKFAAQGNDFAKKMLPRLQDERLINHLPAALKLIENRERLFADLEALNKDGLFEAAPQVQGREAGADADKAGADASAEAGDDTAHDADVSAAQAEETPPDPADVKALVLATIKAGIGATLEGAGIDRTDQGLLKQKMLAFQSDAFFSEGWTGPKNGLYSDEFAGHLAIRAAAMPETTDAEKQAKVDMQAFTEALKTASEEYGLDLVSPKDRMSPAEASVVVEAALGPMGRTINGFLAGKQREMGNAQAEMQEFAGSFDLSGIFKTLARGSSLLKVRVPEVENPDEVFDMRSQAALQALLKVLGDPNVMNIPHLAKGGVYEPALGQQIIGQADFLKGSLKRQMAAEQFAEIEPMLTQENLQQFIDALDVLHENGRIARESLFVNNKAAELPVLNAEILTQKVDQLGRENPDALKLMDGLLRQYTGVYGIPALLAGNEALEGEIDPSKTPEARLQEFYKNAKAKHIADGGTHEEFSAEMILILNTILAMPFGSAEQRASFSAGVRDSVKNAAAESDPARASEVFAAGVVSASAGMAGGPAGFKHEGDPSRGVASHPQLEGATFTSGGKAYTGEEIRALYDSMNAARGAVRGTEAALFFTDDKGETFAAAIHEESGLFMVEKVNAENMRSLLTADDVVSRAGELRQDDPAFGLVFQKTRNLGLSYVDFAHTVLTAGDVPTLGQEMAAGYAEKVEHIRQAAAQEAERKAPVIPVSNALPPSLAQGGGEAGADAPLWRRGLPASEVDVASAGAGPAPVRQSPEDEAESDRLRKTLTEEAAPLRRYPVVLQPGDPRLEVFQAATGQEWRIGASPGSSFQLKGVDMSRSSGSGAQVAWYDAKEKIVKIADAPVEMVDPGAKAAIRLQSGEDQLGYYERIRSGHPLLFEIAQEYHPQRGEYWGFFAIVDVAVGDNEPSAPVRMPNPLPQPKEEQSWLAGIFSRKVDEKPAPVEERFVPRAEAEKLKAAAFREEAGTITGSPADGKTYAASEHVNYPQPGNNTSRPGAGPF